MSSKKNEKKKTEKREMEVEHLILYRICLGSIPFLIAAVVISYVWGDNILNSGAECNFRRLTGLYCIGCGGTRSFYYLTRFNLVKSFFYHPDVPITFFMYLFSVINSFLYRHGKKCFEKFDPFIPLYISLGLLVVIFIVRNILVIFFKIYIIG